MDNRLQATINAYKCVEKALNCYDNVTMYYFPAMEDVVTDLNNYADYTHYHPRVNRFMTECFLGDEYRISKDDNDIEMSMDSYINKLNDMLDTYDFEMLNEKIRNYHKN